MCGLPLLSRILAASVLAVPTPFVGGMLLPMGLILLFTTVLFPVVTVQDADTVPFTVQELWWAARDGYLTTMFTHYIRNGGL
jgi:hypothetical protein